MKLKSTSGTYALKHGLTYLSVQPKDQPKTAIMAIRIALVEDHPKVRENFIQIFEIFDEVELLFTAQNGAEFLSKVGNTSPKPDLVLMDIEMPIMDGIEATTQYLQKEPEAKVLVLSISKDDLHIRRALAAGAVGYVTKDESAKIIVRSIVDAFEGRLPLSPEIAKKTRTLLGGLESVDTHQSPESYNLSKREMEVLEHLYRGLTYNEIAKKLVLSPLTIRSHMENLYKKMKVHNKVEAVQVAMKNQWFI